MRVKVKVAELEFEEGGNTLWVHSPEGGTVLRIQALGGIVAASCSSSPISHADVSIKGQLHICVGPDAIKEGAIDDQG